MRALVLADGLFASRERSLLSRLEVGLADEGVRLIHATPGPSDGARDRAGGSDWSGGGGAGGWGGGGGSTLGPAIGSAGDEVNGSTVAGRVGGGEVLSPVFARSLRYQPAAWGPLRRLNARRVVRAVREIIEQEGGSAESGSGLGVVHAFGGSAWELAFDLAREFNAAVALEVWRAGLVQRARDLRPHAGTRVALLAPDPAIERALTLAVGAGGPRVTLAPWGVHAADRVPDAMDPTKPLSVMVVGAGRDARAYAAAFDGLATLCRAWTAGDGTGKGERGGRGEGGERGGGGEVEIFCDALAARRAGVWAIARKAELLGRLSLIEELEARRDMLLQGDILLLPENAGEQRTVVLEAMATGVLVVAAADPYLSVLEDLMTAVVVRHPVAEEWRSALLDVATKPERARSVVRRAYAMVRDKRRASEYVRCVLGAYEWMASATAGVATR